MKGLSAVSCASVLVVLVLVLPHCHGLKYLTYYGFDAAQQHDWSNLGITPDLAALAASKTQYNMPGWYGGLPDCSGCGRGVIDRAHKGLDPNWKKNLAAIVTSLRPFIANGTVTGVFLGDEICCAGVPYSNLTSVANALRSALGPDVTLYTNECMEMEKWSVVPSALDYISLDLYDYHNGTNEPVIVRQAYERIIYPKLQPHQGAFVVPGTFACSGQPLGPQAVQVVDKLQGFLEWAKMDGRLVGFNPWHFNNRSHAQHPPPCDMRVGAVAMPTVLAELQVIGNYIHGSNA